MTNLTVTKWAKDIARQITSEAGIVMLPPQEGKHSQTQQVIARSLVTRTRNYIEHIVEEINCSYECGSYNACAVMIRRLVETLIIECFEAKGISPRIKDAQDNFLLLKDLVDKTIAESDDPNGVWNLGRNTKEGLRRIRDKGNLAAHNRRFIAHRSDIDDLKESVRVVAQELIIVANIQRPKEDAQRP